ncbi:MAG: sel1 repeat family protein [Deltaproteobacteria bacterium]|nr:sel1 repeat family protein [Deltaproteobacteria bacterium]
MCPPDPAPRDDDDEEADELSPDAHDLDALKLRGDVAAILSLAKAYRAGNAHVARDMQKCLDAYRAAAELGSGEASYAVALFHANGGVVRQDLKEAVTHLRAAAERGSVPAKVYLGNLYELGVHYKADAEKADVWYRNAARGAKIDAAPGSPEYEAALADLGCVRYVLELTKSASVDDAEKARLLARAKAHGHGLRIRSEDSLVPGAEAERPTFVDALARAESAAPTATPPPVAVAASAAATKGATAKVDARPTPREAPARPEPEKKNARGAAPARNVSQALAAFGYAILFALAGIGAGYAAMLGAHELIARGHALPGIGKNARLVFPIVLAIVGVLPSALVYRLGAVAKALLAGAAFGGIGWVAWGTGQAALHADRALQALGFGLAGFLATLLVLGLLGGTKSAKARR